MTLGDLLTFVALLIASYSILNPSYRSLVKIFINIWLLIIMILFVALLLLSPQILGYIGYYYHVELAELLSQGSSFFLLIVLLVYYGIQLKRHRLLSSHTEQFCEFVLSALKEREYNGLHLLIESNIDSLPELLRNRPRTFERLFDPAFVNDSIKKQSWIHLKMLTLKIESGNKYLFEILPDQIAATGKVVRALLRSEATPIHKKVVRDYGGHEDLKAEQEEKELVERTFLDPTWFMKTAAYSPLVIYATERLLSGKLDKLYNSSPDLYIRSQGISLRSRCPVWIAEKTIVLAIKNAIKKGERGDMYVTTLFDIFKHVCDRSKYDPTVWDTPPREYPSPYAYLLQEVCYDLTYLASDSLREAWTGDIVIQDPNDAPQLEQIARTWSFCVYYIADREESALENFRVELVRNYLDFLLQVRFSPHDLLHHPPTNLPQPVLERYGDFFLGELTSRSFTDKRCEIIKKAIDTLDRGKRWVMDGRQWLKDKKICE